MRLFRRIVLGLVVLLVVGVVAAYWYQRPLIRTGTGYAAHNACAVTHLAARDDPSEDLPDNPLVPYLRVREIGDSQVRASLLGLWSRQYAWYTTGFGCTLGKYRPDLPVPTVVSPAANPFAAAPRPKPSAPVQEAVAKAFADGLGTRAVVVVQDGELVAERYAPGFGPDTPQLGWSMAKSATNLLVGRLVKEGQVALDDDQLRPEWEDDERADITVDMLLRMTSGLEWDETYDLGTPITRMLYDEPDMGSYVASLPSVHEPGTYQQYSSGSTTLLCSILLEAKNGADVPRKELFAPLGLASAVLEPDAAGTPVCSSYLWASPRDWAAIGQFALQDGEWNGEQLLPKSWMNDSTKAVDVETEDPGYAAGWWVNELPDGSLVEPSLPEDAYWARGHDGQRLIVVPSEQLVVVRLGFSPDLEEVGAFELAADLVDLRRR